VCFGFRGALISQLSDAEAAAAAAAADTDSISILPCLLILNSV